MKPITFPNLGLSFNINSIAFSIGNKNIYWYGIIITAGIVLALLLAYRNRKNEKIKWDDITDFVLWAIPIGIICARLYYVIFKWDYYSKNLLEIIMIPNGRSCDLWRHNRWHNSCTSILQNKKNKFL